MANGGNGGIDADLVEGERRSVIVERATNPPELGRLTYARRRRPPVSPSARERARAALPVRVPGSAHVIAIVQ